MVGGTKLRGEPKDAREQLQREIRARHPRFREAVVADAAFTAKARGERHDFVSGLDSAAQALRLAVQSDAFLAHVAYRAKARMQALGIPLLPRLAHRIAMATAQVSIGDPVVMQPGVYIVHGQVVADGLMEIRSGTVLSPWVTLGLVPPELIGPTVGPHAHIGTGARVLGKVRVGTGARVGANAVVLDDVPDGATAVGVPAKVIEA